MSVLTGLFGRVWPFLFFLIVGMYGLAYAPYGINETDGGFLTGLAWQVLQGKVLYQDLVYVRPPLPVWLRALELQLLPAHWAILGERWIFYGKLALYSWLAAAVLTTGTWRWQLATLGFIVSAHCYPAAAWHTVDGILFAVLAAWCLFKGPGIWGAALGGLALLAALLCKQSFYPLALAGLAAAYFSPRGLRAVAALMLGMLAGSALFFNYLYQHQLLTGFLRLTGGAASGGQAWQHGVVDYFHIQPVLALVSVLLLALTGWCWLAKNYRWAYGFWAVWLAALMASYAVAIWRNQDFTPPFAQARLLLWVAGAWWFYQLYQQRKGAAPATFSLPAFGFMLAIAWCSAISWGYNLPILFAVPGVWALLEIGRVLQRQVTGQIALVAGFLVLPALLGVNRYGYEFVYRDGQRSNMTEDLGQIFPALGGIYSTPETRMLYRELQALAAKYGPNFKTLPSFPQANFLTHTAPPLPLDWVVAREMNADSSLVMSTLINNRPVLFLEKKYLNALETDPELMLLRPLLQSAERVEETQYFLVLRLTGF